MTICKHCGTEYVTKNCGACNREAQKRWRKNNPNAARLVSVRSYQKNKEKAKARVAKYRLDNVDKVRESKARAYRAHPEKAKIYSEKYKSEHIEQLRRARVLWLKNNKEKMAEYYKAYRKAEKENNPQEFNMRRRLYRHNRRVKEKNNGGTIPNGIVEKLFRLQQGKCPCCGFPLGKDFHLDHKMPVTRGGTNEEWNFQLLRKSCNLAKSAKHPIDFMQSRGFLL